MSPSDRQQLRRRAKALAAGNEQVVERFFAEMEFAEGLTRLHPRRAGRWNKLMDLAWSAVEKAVSAGRAARLKGAVRSAEEILAPIGKVAKGYTIHCVGHGHIDMNWMWSWPETVAVTNDTFITVLKLMEEFPEFCFTQSQASVYAIVRDYSPELLEQIRARVAEGRWEIAAVHWVEGDKNLAAGEAIARHMLYTRRFMTELFGPAGADQPLDWEPDTFGHAHTIPTIVSGGGVRRYYMCRGGMFEKPPVFWWQGPDGSRVLVHLDAAWYGGELGPRVAGQMLSFWEKAHLKDAMLCYGVGDHGGGPTRRDILRAREMTGWPIFPAFRLNTTRRYYQILERNGERWPVLDRELNFEFTGCYTSQTQIKKAIRFGENHLLEAEAAAVLAHRALGRDYPAAALRQGWIDTLFGHFHDILPGSGVRATREYQMGLFQEVAASTGMIKTHALRALAAAVDTSWAGAAAKPAAESTALGAGAGRGAMLGGISTAGHVADGPRPFVVFNPTAWPRSEVITVTVWDAGDGPGEARDKRFIVRTPDGQVLPAQKLGEGKYWGHRYVELALPASAGPLGYSTFVVAEGQAEPPQAGVKVGPRFGGDPYGHAPGLEMENDLIKVRIDNRTGGIASLVDKATGCELADPARPMGVLEYVLERPRGMSAWIIGEAEKRIRPLEVHSLRGRHRGPHLVSVVVGGRFQDSTFTVSYVLKAGQPWLEIDFQATWLERGGPDAGTPSLRMLFPTALDEARGRYEIPFGSIQRELSGGEEVPALRWADVAGKAAGGKAAGCALLNDCKYGHSLHGATLGLTLVRSSYEPDPLPEIGEHTARLALMPHGRPLAVAELIRAGAALNHPLLAAATDVHEGALPPAAAAVSAVRPANVILSSIKKAEADPAVVFRLYETAGKDARASVKLDATLMGAAAEAVEVDLLERPVGPGSARAGRTGFTVNVPARGIASVKVRFCK